MISIRSLPGSTTPVVETLPEPTAGPGQVVLAVHAATINPADTFVLSDDGREAFGLSGTIGLGYDVAGVVVEVGEGVTTVRPGERVAGLHADLTSVSRAQAERVVLPVDAVAPIPDGVDDVAAATVPLNGLTASQALDGLGTPEVGSRLLVTGAAGAVGGHAVALASRRGWTVLGLARESDRDFVTAVGGQLVTDLPDRAVDAVVDAAALQAEALGAVVDGGKFVGVLPPAPVTPERGIEVSAVMVTADARVLADLLQLTAAEVLPVRVAGTGSLKDPVPTYESFARGGRGRWVLTT